MSRHHSETSAVVSDRLFVGTPEAAQLLGLDQRTIRRALESGQIPGFRVGACWRIPTAWVRQAAGMDDGDAATA